HYAYSSFPHCSNHPPPPCTHTPPLHDALPILHERPHVRAAASQIEHDIGDPLSRAVIGVPAATAGPEHRKTIRLQQLGRVGAGADRKSTRLNFSYVKISYALFCL